MEVFSPDMVVADRYRLIAPLGSGAMGAVWRAEHTVMRTPVALKVMHAERVDDEGARARFVREARATSSLSSPNIVRVLDAGMHGHTPYMAMELLEGESLHGRLQRSRLTPRETLSLVAQIGDGLSAAHDANIVHRDLKPQNVFLVPKPDGSDLLKLLDFGIAKLRSPELGDSFRTRTGEMLGTPYYMSPEQLRSSKNVDHRADLWALTVMTFECLLGERPYQAKRFGDLVLEVCVEPTPIPSEVGSVPAGFDAWFARGVAKELDDRFRSAEEAVSALHDALS